MRIENKRHTNAQLPLTFRSPIGTTIPPLRHTVRSVVLPSYCHEKGFSYVPWMDTNLTVQQAVDKNVAYDLKQIGFESQWTDPGTSGNDRRPMWGSASRN